MAEAFADPDIPDETVKLVKNIARSEGPIEPWTLLNKVAVHGIDKSEARKALRELRLSNTIVPAGDFIGKVRLVES